MTPCVAALERALAFRRFRAADIRAILAPGRASSGPRRPVSRSPVELPAVPVRALAAYAVEVGLGERRVPAPLAPDLEAALRRLKLAAVRRLAPEVLQTAKTQRWAPDELLRTLLEAELAARDASNARARLRAAGFPVSKTLDEFQVAASSVPRATFDYLAGLEWIRGPREPRPRRARGDRQESTCSWPSAWPRWRPARGSATSPRPIWSRPSIEASPTTPWAASSRASCAHDLVIVDELGFAPLDDVGTQLLFRFVAAAYERRSLGLASHWPFEIWGRFLPEHTTAVVAPRPAPPPRRGRRHRGRVLPHARGPLERRWSPDEALRRHRGWGLLMATGGDFHMAIDRRRGDAQVELLQDVAIGVVGRPLPDDAPSSPVSRISM